MGAAQGPAPAWLPRSPASPGPSPAPLQAFRHSGDSGPSQHHELRHAQAGAPPARSLGRHAHPWVGSRFRSPGPASDRIPVLIGWFGLRPGVGDRS